MFPSMALRTALKSSCIVLKESSGLSKLTGACSTLSTKSVVCASALTARPGNSNGAGSFAVQSARHYARAVRKQTPVTQSQLSDLTPAMLKMDYANVPLAQTTDDVVKRLLTLELASHSEKLHLKTEQMIAKVQRDKTDRRSEEVKVAILTARIRNYREHMQKHHKDKANKRWMLMAIDRRKKILKNLRFTSYDAFENVCQQLGITYTFPPEYYRRTTRRWLEKKALCIKVFEEVQKQKAERKLRMKQLASAQAEAAAEAVAAVRKARGETEA